MDENLGKFIEDFGILVRLAQSGQDRSGGEQLLTVLSEHLGTPVSELSVVVETVPAHRLVDVDILLESIARRDANYKLVGLGGGDSRNHMSFSDVLQQARMFPRFPITKPDYTNLAVAPDQQRQAVALGLWLFTYAGSPLAVLQRAANPQFGRQTASLEVIGLEPSATANFLAEGRHGVGGNSVFKGQIIAPTAGDYGPSIGGITFVQRPELASSDVILPDGLLSRLEQHVLGIGRAAELLRAQGQHLK